MGGFLLFEKNTRLNTKAARELFQKKGFDEPREFSLGSMILWAYRKQLESRESWSQDEQGNLVFVDGTLVYKGKGIEKSRLSLLSDFRQGRIENEELIGSFCAVCHLRGRTTLLIDPMHIYHLFANDEGTVFSSSFLALLAASAKPYRLNREGLLENLAAGCIIGPETLVHGISVVSPVMPSKIPRTHVDILELPVNLELGEVCPSRRAECVAYEVEQLRAYFRAIGKMVEETGIDVGLSGGYDSRLLAGLAHEAFGKKLTLHTHATRGGHTLPSKPEKATAEKIASYFGISLRFIESLSPAEMDAVALVDNLCDSIYYYDGRTNHCMGNYHYTNTRDYRIRIMRGTGLLGVNGLNGEIFRNFDMNILPRVHFVHWLQLNYFYPGFHAAFRTVPDQTRSLIGRLREKDIAPS